MRQLLFCFLVTIFIASAASFSNSADEPKKSAVNNSSDKLEFTARYRRETKAGSVRYHQLHKTISWDPKKTALVVCDMWNGHTCPTSAARVAEMAPKMNDVICIARKRGILIIHCPSDCMDFYKNTPQRKLAQQAPVVKTKIALKRWCSLDKKHEPSLPIDDSDHGCDTEKGIKQKALWTRQIAAIKIEQADAVTDSAEAYYLMKQRGIKNVIVMGVHTNRCVLGRPFSIRQMIYQGQNVVLMRDMTDTMYNPKRSPFVSHFTGTDLVCDHIEAHWCPTITSSEFTGKAEFRFKNDRRKHIVFIMAELEYETNKSLPTFAIEQLGKHFRLTFVHGNLKQRNDIPGLEAVKSADLVVLSVRRRTLPKKQLQLIHDYLDSGKPLIGIRTANHAFSLRNAKPAEGHASWRSFDTEVLGGNYQGHHPNNKKNIKSTMVRVIPKAKNHPILNGIDIGEFSVATSLYKTSPLTKSTKALMIGRIEGIKQREPVAWTNQYKRSRIFYTSLGGPKDFKNKAFQKLLFNAVFWVQKMDLPK